MKKDIVGYEGRYCVDERGSVFRKDGSEIGQWMNDQGYMLVRLSSPRKTMRVHRLVAEAFIQNPENRPFVNHIDCVKHNNQYTNLEWCTQWENINHSALLGRMQKDYWKGRRSPNAKLSDDVVQNIRSAYAAGGLSWLSIGERFGVSKRTVGRIVRNESYKLQLPHPPKED